MAGRDPKGNEDKLILRRFIHFLMLLGFALLCDAFTAFQNRASGGHCADNAMIRALDDYFLGEDCWLDLLGPVTRLSFRSLHLR